MDNVSSSPIFIRAGERGRFPVTGNSTKEVVNAKEGNVRIDNVNWVLPNTSDYESYPAKRFIPSYQRNQSVCVDGHSAFFVVNQEQPTKINLGNVVEIDGKFYLLSYDELKKEYLPDMSKEIAKENLGLYANAVGKDHMPKVYNIEISNIKVTNADPRYPMILMGLTDSPIQNVVIKNIDVEYRGGLKMEHAVEQRQLNTNWKYTQFETKTSIQTLPWLVNTFFLKSEGLLPRLDWDEETNAWREDPYNVPEMPEVYPEPSNWGILPAYGLYARHVEGLELSDIKLSFQVEDERHAIVLDDIKDVSVEGLNASIAKDVAKVAKVTNNYKRHTNLEYVKNEAYFTTTVTNLLVSDTTSVEEIVVNAPAPGTPNDTFYTKPTLPIPENGYTYKIETKDYPLPQTVFRPFIMIDKEPIVNVNQDLSLKFKVRNPASQTTMEETDGQIYNETVAHKDYLVKGVENEVKISITNLPKGASFDMENGCFLWKPNENQMGEYTLNVVLDDGILSEEIKVSIKVLGNE
jgi:Putative Ig domain